MMKKLMVVGLVTLSLVIARRESTAQEGTVDARLPGPRVRPLAGFQVHHLSNGVLELPFHNWTRRAWPDQFLNYRIALGEETDLSRLVLRDSKGTAVSHQLDLESGPPE